MNNISHKVPVKKEIIAEYRSDNVKYVIAIAYIPRKVGIEVWNLIGPRFSLKPK